MTGLHVPQLVHVATESGNTVAGYTQANGTVDIRDACTHCGCDTSPGSGAWVNRIASDWQADANAPMLTGYLCVECQSMECDMCGGLTIEYAMTDAGVLCDECAERAA